MHAIAASQNVKYLVFLQPTMGLSGIQSEVPSGTSDATIFQSIPREYQHDINELYVQLRAICSRLDFCIDISNVAYPTGSLYTDYRHHNKNGNKIIAETIWKQVQHLNF